MTGGECCLSACGSSLQDAHPAFVPFIAFISSIIISFSCFVKSCGAGSARLHFPPGELTYAFPIYKAHAAGRGFS